MKLKLTISLMAVLLSGCQSMTQAPVTPLQLSADEVRLLLEDRTVESFNLITGTTSFTYYATDGSVYQERYWSQRTGTWNIKPDGQICMSMMSKAGSCRYIFQAGKKYYKYRTDADGNLEKIIRYRQFLDGNMLAK